MTDPAANPEPSSWRQVLRLLLLLLSLGLLAWFIAEVGIETIVEQLLDLDPLWLLAAMACIGLNFCLFAWRFSCLLNARLAFGEVLEIVMASFLLNYASMIQGVGLGAKIGLLKSKGVPVSRSSAVIWLEVNLDILFCSALVAAFLLSSIDLGFSAASVLVLPVLLVVFGACGLLAIKLLSARWPAAAAIVDTVQQAISPGRLALGLLLTAGSWSASGAAYYCLMNALSADQLADLVLSILALASGFLTGLVSLVPGGLGVREITWAYIASQNGFAIELAGIAAVLNRLLPIALVAAWLALSGWLGRRHLAR